MTDEQRTCLRAISGGSPSCPLSAAGDSKHRLLCLLVQKPARSGDPEPPYMHILVIDEPGLVFFDSEADHDKWYAAIMNEGAPVVRLAGRSPPPKRK
jgi:hypothetical protein